MTRDNRDDSMLRYAEGELSQFETKQLERQLAVDPTVRELADDLEALAAAARAAGDLSVDHKLCPLLTARSSSRLTVAWPIPRGGVLMIRSSETSSCGLANTFK